MSLLLADSGSGGAIVYLRITVDASEVSPSSSSASSGSTSTVNPIERSGQGFAARVDGAFYARFGEIDQALSIGAGYDAQIGGGLVGISFKDVYVGKDAGLGLDIFSGVAIDEVNIDEGGIASLSPDVAIDRIKNNGAVALRMDSRDEVVNDALQLSANADYQKATIEQKDAVNDATNTLSEANDAANAAVQAAQAAAYAAADAQAVMADLATSLASLKQEIAALASVVATIPRVTIQGVVINTKSLDWPLLRGQKGQYAALKNADFGFTGSGIIVPALVNGDIISCAAEGAVTPEDCANGFVVERGAIVYVAENVTITNLSRKIVIRPGGMLVIKKGVTLKTRGTIENNGVIACNGKLDFRWLVNNGIFGLGLDAALQKGALLPDLKSFKNYTNNSIGATGRGTVVPLLRNGDKISIKKGNWSPSLLANGFVIEPFSKIQQDQPLTVKTSGTVVYPYNSYIYNPRGLSLVNQGSYINSWDFVNYRY